MIFFLYISVISICMYIFLVALQLNFVIAGGFTICIGVSFFLVSFYTQQKAFLKILDEKCDPKRFLEIMNKQKKRFKRDKKMVNIAEYNCAVSYMLLGKTQEAKDCILGIDTDLFFANKKNAIIYVINLMLCYYELGEIEEAESLYEENLEKIRDNKCGLDKIVEILSGMRYYFLKQFDQSYEVLESLLSSELSTRLYLGVLFYLAKMDQQKGNVELAKNRFHEVAKKGNTLWIAQEAKQILNNQLAL